MTVKRVFILVLVFLMTTVIGMNVAPAKAVQPDAFLLKIRNATTLDISYLRFDLFFDALGADGTDQFAGIVYSAPQAGEDFYRCELIATHPEKMRFLRIELSYGVSDLTPTEAVSQCWRGEGGEEHHLLTLDFTPSLGREYDLELRYDGEQWALV